MSVPTVSVVMPCFNAARTLPTAVDSILRQTMPDFEFIIVDDASTDQTATLLRQYAELDSRVRVLTNSANRGISWCMNQAILTARTRYIARMDADDYCFPDRLGRQVSFMDTHPDVDVLGTGAELVDTNGQLIGSLILPVEHQQIVRQRYLRPFFINPSVLFRREFFSRCGCYDEQLRFKTEDVDLWLRARTSATYHNLPDVLFRYTYKPKIPIRTFYSTIVVRLRHMRISGELVSKGYELGLYSLRFAWLRVISQNHKLDRLRWKLSKTENIATT